VSCAFDLAHYRELLESARTGGYAFGRFEGEPRAGHVYLRHDVDLSLDAAVRMAELEAEAGAEATYFLMRESVFYNLASREGTDAISTLLDLGHTVGVHAIWPAVPDPDERFSPVLAWHNPDPEYMTQPVGGYLNVMAEPWFTQGLYRSDSNQHWRSGCPHEALAGGELEWLQLLIHPEIWVYPGGTMGETMLAMLDAERERRVAQLAEDRIELK
jgi:hypothetical protein